MRIKILGAVLLGAALALAGCSGDGGDTSSTSGSTGSTGNTTSSSTGSSGTSGQTTTSTSTSTGGTNGSACGTCGSGETCQRFTNQQGGHVNSCACTPSEGIFDAQGNLTGETVDTCAANTNGKIVCDEFTYNCRLPQEYEDPNTVGVLPDGGGNRLCDQGFIDIGFCNFGITNGQCDPSPDGGPDTVNLCLALCLSGADCTTATSCRLDSPLGFQFPDGGDATLADGGGAAGGDPIGFCDVNVCGAGAADDGGILNGDFYASCDAHGTGDGECLPVLQDGAGICYAPTAGATVQSICDPSFLDSVQGCALGDQCIAFSNLTGVAGAPNETGTCLPSCNEDAPDSGIYNVTCPAITGASTVTCFGFGEDQLLAPDAGPDAGLAVTGLNGGICIPQ